MQIYRIFDSAAIDPPIHYEGTVKDAQFMAKSVIVSRVDARIELVEVPTDKTTVLLYLNTAMNMSSFTPLRSWKLTARGGLVEATIGE